MSGIGDKVAYLKGLCEGLKIEADTPERKLLLALVDAVNAIEGELKAIRDDQKELHDYMDVLDEDMGELENEVYGDDDDFELEDDDEDDEDDEDDFDEDDLDEDDFDDECDDDCGHEHCHCGHHHDHDHELSDAMLDQQMTERACPACGKPIGITMRALLNKDEPIVCPHCGGKFRGHVPEDE